jgi:hypothetical protein
VGPRAGLDVYVEEKTSIMQIVCYYKLVRFLSCSLVLTPRENGLFSTFWRYLLHPSSVSKYVGLIGPVI